MPYGFGNIDHKIPVILLVGVAFFTAFFSIGLNDLGIVNFKGMGKQIQIKAMVKTNLIQFL